MNLSFLPLGKFDFSSPRFIFRFTSGRGAAPLDLEVPLTLDLLGPSPELSLENSGPNFLKFEFE